MLFGFEINDLEISSRSLAYKQALEISSKPQNLLFLIKWQIDSTITGSDKLTWLIFNYYKLVPCLKAMLVKKCNWAGIWGGILVILNVESELISPIAEKVFIPILQLDIEIDWRYLCYESPSSNFEKCSSDVIHVSIIRWFRFFISLYFSIWFTLSSFARVSR